VALVEMLGQAALDAAGGTAAALQGIAYISITPIIGSYAQCAAALDHIASVPGTKGIMLIFAEYLAGLQEFGERVLPLMRTAKLASPRPPRVRAEELPLALNVPACNVAADVLAAVREFTRSQCSTVLDHPRPAGANAGDRRVEPVFSGPIRAEP
jgi:hypothetical protein